MYKDFSPFSELEMEHLRNRGWEGQAEMTIINYYHTSTCVFRLTASDPLELSSLTGQ